MRAGAVGEHHAVADLLGERDHPPPQRGEDDGWQLAGPRHGLDLVHKPPNVRQGLAPGNAQPIHRRRMADSHAKVEAPAGHLMDEARTLGEVLHMPRVDRRNAGAEANLVGDEGQRFAKRKTIAHGRAIDAGKAATLDLPSEVQGGVAAPRHGGEADRGHPRG